jgi:hypothetical protein
MVSAIADPLVSGLSSDHCGSWGARAVFAVFSRISRIDLARLSQMCLCAAPAKSGG